MIWIDAGIHAREWVAPATATFVINELVRSYTNKTTRGGKWEYVSEVDWLISPSINPDGYEHSWKVRMWRKNRRPQANGCVGVDLNRNFDHHWMAGGASTDPCSDIFAGPSANSEPETKAVAAILHELKHKIKVYISFHAFGLYWLTPWAWTSDLPDDYHELEALARKGAAAAHATYNESTFTINTSTRAMYVSAGGSDDYAKGNVGIKYVYTIELRDKGEFAFLLPKDQIIKAATEAWNGVKVVADFVVDNYHV